MPAQVLTEPFDARRAGVRVAFRGVAAPEVVGFSQRIGLAGVEDRMTHGTVAQPGEPGGLEAAAARDRDVRRTFASDQQRLQDAVRGD